MRKHAASWPAGWVWLGVLAGGLAALAPGVRGETAATQPGQEKYRAHVEALTKRVPGGFTIVPARPFVVVGDEPADIVRQRAAQTVGWAVRLLKRDYFSKDPDPIIDIWLFQDQASYRQHAWELFHDRPTTPYGYYSARHHALIMNIATGG